VGNLDVKCRTILKTLIVHGRELRFNELHRRVLEIDAEFSKPTFLLHLNHLKKSKYIVRQRKGKQNVSYRFDYEKFKYLDSFVKYRNLVNEYLAQDERGILAPISNVGQLLLVKAMQLLKYKILESLEPKRKSELYLPSLLINEMLLEPVEDWLIQKCVNDKEYCEEVLAMIDEGTKSSIDGIFEGHEEIQREFKSLVKQLV